MTASPRTRGGLLPLGCIVCDELQVFGAGKQEGWIYSDPHLNISISPPFVAFATQKTVLIVDWSSESFKTLINHSSSLDGNLTSMEWLCFHRYRALALGTSFGLLLIYSATGDLLHKQTLYSSDIVSLRVRGVCNAPQENLLSNELCVIFRSAILRIDASDLQSLLTSRFDDLGGLSGSQQISSDGADSERLPYQIWSINKCGPCIDGAITGIMSLPLMEDQSSQYYYGAITIGADATFGAFRLSIQKNKSLVGAILSKVMPATVSTISSFAKIFWRSDQQSARPADVKPQTFQQASMVTCLRDSPRRGERFAISPSGSLAAVTDSLGRILLVDTQALVVIRMWKGYRDACCLFLEMPLLENMSTIYNRGYGNSKNEFCLCLAIHAPRRGVVEVWKMRTGPRIMTLQCAKGCQLLQPAGILSDTHSRNCTPNYVPMLVYLLDGDSGQVSLLNPAVQPSST